MGYLKNETHFINYLRKYLDEVPPDKTLSLAFYISEIYRRGDGNAFTWELKSVGPSLLEEENTLAWIKNKRTKPAYLRPFNHELTDEFIALSDELAMLPGVYSFWNGDTVLYIGKGVHLGKRMMQSFQRFSTYDRELALRYVVTETDSDALILESYLIGNLNPIFNVQGNYEEQPELEIANLPDWSEPIPVNTVVRESEEPEEIPIY